MTGSRDFVKAGVLAVAVFSVAPLLGAGEGSETRADERPVKYRTIDPQDFASFVMNWDSKKHPALLALIRTPDEWKTVFHPAPIMGRQRPFAPDQKVYEKEQLLVVARVMAPPGDDRRDKVFQVEKIVAGGKELVLRYRFNKPKKDASYFVKHYLGVLVPKRDYGNVVFVENGVRIGALEVSKGQRSIPASDSQE